MIANSTIVQKHTERYNASLSHECIFKNVFLQIFEGQQISASKILIELMKIKTFFSVTNTK